MLCDISNPLDNNIQGRWPLGICDSYDLDSLNTHKNILSAFFMFRWYPDECSRLFQAIRNFGGWLSDHCLVYTVLNKKLRT